MQQELADAQSHVLAAQDSLAAAKARLQGHRDANEKLVRRAAEAALALVSVIAPSPTPSQQPPSRHVSTSSTTTANRCATGALPATETPTATQPAASAPRASASPSPPPVHTPSGATEASRALSGAGTDCSGGEVSMRPAPFEMAPVPPPTVNAPLTLALPKQDPFPPTAHCAPLSASEVFADPFPTLDTVAGGAAVRSNWDTWPDASAASATNRFDFPAGGGETAAADSAAIEPDIRMVEAVVADAAERISARRRVVAAAARVPEADVRWVVQIPYDVPQSGAAGTAAMSCSTAVASAACMVSLFAFFVCSRFEGACVAAALDRSSWPPQEPRASPCQPRTCSHSFAQSHRNCQM